MWASRNQRRDKASLRQFSCPSADRLRNQSSSAPPQITGHCDRPDLQLQGCPHDISVDRLPCEVHNGTDDSSEVLSCTSPSHGQEERWGVSLQRFLRSLTVQLVSTSARVSLARTTGLETSASFRNNSQICAVVATDEEAFTWPAQLRVWPYASSITQDAFECYALERLSPVVCSNQFFNAVCGPGHETRHWGWGGGREFDRRRDHALYLRLRSLHSLRVRAHSNARNATLHECSVPPSSAKLDVEVTRETPSCCSRAWAYLMPRHFEPRFAELEEHMYFGLDKIRRETQALNSRCRAHGPLQNACICDGWARAAYALHAMDTARTPAGKVCPSFLNIVVTLAFFNTWPFSLLLFT